VSTDERLVGGDRVATVQVESVRNVFLDHEEPVNKEALGRLTSENRVLCLAYSRHDLHQDHLVASELAWNAFRDHTIIEDEIAKYYWHLADPNVLGPSSNRGRRRKIRILMSAPRIRSRMLQYSSTTFDGLKGACGVECAVGEGYPRPSRVGKGHEVRDASAMIAWGSR
jgi:LmbE family N-acetylglucosaminyl deacetylase